MDPIAGGFKTHMAAYVLFITYMIGVFLCMAHHHICTFSVLQRDDIRGHRAESDGVPNFQKGTWNVWDSCAAYCPD